MKKRRKKNNYFRQEHQDAIVEYARIEDHVRRNELYNTFIGPVFSEMVDKIVYTYKFTTLPNIDSLKEECKIWLTTVIGKFNPDKGSKAFSYFSVITKNWFIHKVKKTSKQNRTEISFEEILKEIEHERLSTKSDYTDRRMQIEFWNSLLGEIEGWKNNKMKENERKVLEAVSILLDSPESIDIFNKKAIYLYMREITGLKTKQIVLNLNKFRERYRLFAKRWHGE
ncbi:hypothetical protein CL634_08285 [bacterium]|nr:hypothetical protein [bacterium]